MVYINDQEKSLLFKMLPEVPLFSGLKRQQINSVVNSFARARSYRAGDLIEKEGDRAVVFYLITDGSVEVRRSKKLLSRLGRGQFFGEMALIDKQTRSATIVAGDKGTKCLLMPIWDFKGALKSDPKLAIGIMRELARRLRDATTALA